MCPNLLNLWRTKLGFRQVGGAPRSASHRSAQPFAGQRVMSTCSLRIRTGCPQTNAVCKCAKFSPQTIKFDIFKLGDCSQKSELGMKHQQIWEYRSPRMPLVMVCGGWMSSREARAVLCPAFHPLPTLLRCHLLCSFTSWFGPCDM